MLATTLLGYTIDTVWSIIVLIIWIAIAFWPARIASRKGHSFFLWFLISIPFWWITFFVVLMLKDKSPAPTVIVQNNPPTE